MVLWLVLSSNRRKLLRLYRHPIHPSLDQSFVNMASSKSMTLRREGSTAVASAPPLAPAKAFSRSGCVRIFLLFSGVMRARLLTGTLPSRPESVLSAPIFSRPIACAVLVNRYQTSVYQGNYSDVNPTWMGVASGADATRVELSGVPSPLILQPALRPVPFRRSRSRWSRCEARKRED